MDLNKLYEKQAKLDKHILEKHNIKMSKEELLDNTILALLVEVSELANTTRCFKHWSTKGMMDKEVVIDELADVIHFYLSIGNQVLGNSGYIAQRAFEVGEKRMLREKDMQFIFQRIYYWVVKFSLSIEYPQCPDMDSYRKIGDWIYELCKELNFTDEEVEQAYLKKHEENYKRQREGY